MSNWTDAWRDKNGPLLSEDDELLIVKNLDTGERVSLADLPQHGLAGRESSREKAPMQLSRQRSASLPTSKPILGKLTTFEFEKRIAKDDSKVHHDASPIVFVFGEDTLLPMEIFIEGSDSSKGVPSIGPPKVKLEPGPKFPSMYTIKLAKTVLYTFKFVLKSSEFFKVIKIMEIELDGIRMPMKTDSLVISNDSYTIEGDYTLPFRTKITPDSVRNQMNLRILFQAQRIQKTSFKKQDLLASLDNPIVQISTVEFKEPLQCKVYNADVSGVHTGEKLKSVSTKINIETEESLSGFNYH